MLKSEGVIPLFYKTLVGNLWPLTKTKGKSTLDRKIHLKDIYPYIFNISFEFYETYKLPVQLAVTHISLIQVSPNDFRLEVSVVPISGDKKIEKAKYSLISQLKAENDKFVSAVVNAASEKEALAKLSVYLPRHLIYSHSQDLTLTPASKSKILLPEEFPILLAFFHLSNVVRYNPVWLKRLFDSSSVTILESLARHGTFK